MKEKSTWGGARPNSGRPKGGENPATKEKKLIKKEMEQRVIRSAEHLLTSQMNLAKGASFLMHIYYTGEGKNKKKHIETIKSQDVIEQYFAGELDNLSDNEWYFITTEKPDNRAIDSLFDRTFGKAVTKTELTGADGKDLFETKDKKSITDKLKDIL